MAVTGDVDADRPAGEVFGALYSDCYDAFYASKDYEAESDLLADAFRRFAEDRVKTVVDFGCGTGGHALPLARRGYRVTGVDRSSRMLDRARDKLQGSGVELVQGDVRTVDLSRTYDAAVMMFAVLGYQSSNEDVVSALKTVSQHLRPGGLFAFDVWYGPAVLLQRPGERAKVCGDNGREVIRIARSDVDYSRHLVSVHYEVLAVEPHKGLRKSRETHIMRFFFPQELRLFLSVAGMTLVSLSAFDRLGAPPSQEDWNVFGIARKG